MNILVINAGSSSLKYELFDMRRKETLTAGAVEKIGEAVSHIEHTSFRDGQKRETKQTFPVENHRQALKKVMQWLLDKEHGAINSASDIAAVGHRVVHGGERFSQPSLITEEVKAAISALTPFAPLHNPANLMGIEVVTEMFPDTPQVAVFDTAFHQTMPPVAYRYALPHWLYEQHGIRVYGFHGTSHGFITQQASQYLGKSLETTHLITLHLGNGCSITAVQGGKSIDTSMGFSPLAGLMMGSRSGDLDPAVVYFLGSQLDMSFQQIDQLLNKESGLLGISGFNDLRDIESRCAEGDAAAQLALAMYTYRIKKYIGAYVAILGQVDALVFTAGVGQNSALVRAQACAGLDHLGIVLDSQKNKDRANGPVTEIQTAASRIKVLIIPTNEELEIAQQTLGLIKQIAA